MLMAKKFMHVFYRPVLFFFLLPIFQIILGSLFSLKYNALHILSLLFLYLFVLCNQMLENILLRIPNNDFTLNKPFLAILEGVNLLVLIYFGFAHSWLASLVLLLFSLYIQGQFLFSYYDLEHVATILAVLLKMTLINGFSFYTNTGFLQLGYLPYSLALFIPFYLYEAAKVHPEMTQRSLMIMLGLSYVLGIGTLWMQVSVTSLTLLLSLPFAWLLMKKELNRKTTSLFAIMFATLYVVCLIIGL